MNNEIIIEIKKKMIDKEYNQSDLANKVGLNNYMISKLLNGKSNPTVKTLNKVLNELGLTIKIVEKNDKLR